MRYYHPITVNQYWENPYLGIIFRLRVWFRFLNHARCLEIVREIRVQVEEQAKLYRHYFFQWERENRQSRCCGEAETLEKEKAAQREIFRLEAEARRLLDREGFHYYIPNFNTELTWREGWVSVTNYLQSWQALEEFFASRAK